MSIHSSLRPVGGKTGALRNVLKRHERIRQMMAAGRWSNAQPVFGLPKLKVEKRKVRKSGSGKEKEAEKPAEGEKAAAK